ncbi:SGNH/GDSL hydrolase family protein [Dictyobacter formicarum]|uniref:Endoglucanase n=1 Tax=Dictyobacter formicarum TaxID=2778368 RepID=A0ABQ3VNR4_9CHLR|nr:SGNH/GDSL hydrolase family protein [Dictyobacter formicarum]GHO87306.1 endoglucanase [Dictyobacter formicarum]
MGSMRRYAIVGIVMAALLLATAYTFYAWPWLHPREPLVNLLSVQVSPVNTDIKYYGRWDMMNRHEYVSYWGGAYLKTAFSGRHVELRLGEAANVFVSIDRGPDVLYHGTKGVLNLTPLALLNGDHSLRVTTGSEWTSIHFQGLILDTGARILSPQVSPEVIEFIGDSITAGYSDKMNDLSSYAWLTAEQLGAEHVQIATSGICLSSMVPSCAGMNTQYFKLQTLQYPDSPLWDTRRFIPNVLVINLGTNDYNHGQSASAFELSYLAFIQNLRQHYPNTPIYVLRTFSGYMELPTRAAVDILNASGDHNVFYIDTTGWLTPGSSDFSNRLHPSDSGQRKVAFHLAAILRHRHSGEV